MSQLNINTLGNQTGSEEVPIDDVIHGTARAWVNFNGTGTVAIRASYNVNSITDTGVGDYTVNFTDPMPDTDFVVMAMVKAVSGSTVGITIDTAAAFTPNSISLVAITAAGNAADSPWVNVAVFR